MNPSINDADMRSASAASTADTVHQARSTPATTSKQHCRMLQVERFFRQSRNKLNMFNLFPLCRKDEISFNIVAKNTNNVVATFDNVALTLLLVWTGL